MPPSPGPSRPPPPAAPSVIHHPGGAPTSHPRLSPPRAAESSTSTVETSSEDEDDDGELVFRGGERASWAQQRGGAAAAPTASTSATGLGEGGPLALNGSAATSITTGGRRRSFSHASATSSAALPSAARRSSLLRASEGGRRAASAQWGDQSTSDDEGMYEGLGGGGGRPRRLSSGAAGGGGRRRSGSAAGTASFVSTTPTPTLSNAGTAAPHAASFFASAALPFSRPASAVTAPYAPSRPGSAAVGAAGGRPGSAATQRRIVSNRAGWEEGFEEEQEQEQEQEHEYESGLNGHAHGAVDVKGKGREVVPPPPVQYVPPTPTNDPLDPLSSLRLHASASSSATPLASSPSRASSVHSATQLASTIARPRGPPPPALRPPDPRSSLLQPPPSSSSPRSSSSRNGAASGVPFPASYPSTESLASASSANSTFAGPSSAGSFASGSNPSSSSRRTNAQSQPSLQQLLQTVDLNAALKLVQTLQTQQTQQQKLAATAGAGTTTTTAVPAAGAVVEPVPEAVDPQHPHSQQQQQRLPPSSTFIDFGDHSSHPGPFPPASPASPPAVSRIEGDGTLSPVGPGASSTLAASSSLSPLSPPSPGYPPSSPGAGAHEAQTPEKDKEKKRDRRVSLMGMGMGFGKRARTQSAASSTLTGSGGKAGSSAGVSSVGAAGGGGSEMGTPEKGKGRERFLGERAMLSEGERTFEEEIAKVHLTLSPGTLRRAQNCAKYLSLRYTPLYAALSMQPDDALPLPNPLEAARWRLQNAEEERRSKRSARMGGSGIAGGRIRARLESNGGGAAGGGLAGGEDPLEGRRDSLEGARLGSTRLTEMGSAKAGGAPSPYGPRRNKNPGPWEVYPDELADYVASSGQEAVRAGDVLAAARRGGRPLSPREEKIRAKVDQLFYDPAAAVAENESAHVLRAGSGGAEGAKMQNGSGELARVSTKGSTVSGGTNGGGAGGGGGGSPYLEHPPRPSTLSLSAGSASSVNRAGSTTQRSPKGRPTSSFESPGSRPGQQRQSSYEGSPFARTTSFSNEPYPSSPLRRSTSLSTPAPGSPRSLHNPAVGRPTSSGYAISQTSPRSRLASAQASREDLPETANAPGGPLQPNVPTSRHRHSASHEGFRHGLSRRFDRIRGRTTDGDASDFGPGSLAGRSSSFRRPSDVYEHVGGNGSAEPSEGEGLLRSPSKRFGSPTPWANGNGAMSDSSRRHSMRPYLRKNATSVDLTRANGFESDGFVRSSGDEGSAGGGVWRKASRGLLANAWQGFKATRDGYPDHDPSAGGLGAAFGSGNGGGADSMLEEQRRREAEMRRRRIMEEEEEESDEEEEASRRKRPPREVVDLGDDDFARINSALRQVRNDVSHLDALMPRLPIVLANFLDELTAHETSTRRDARISIDYPFPRIPAAAIAEIARVKEEHLDKENDDSGTESDTESNDSAPSSSTSDEDSSSESSDVSSDRSPSSGHSPSRASRPSRKTRRRRDSDRSSLRMHARHVTEPVEGNKTQGRARSQTMAYPPGVGRSEMGLAEQRPKANGRGSGFSPIQHADPLVVLERVLVDLEKASSNLEGAAEKVTKEQEDVDGQIAAAVGKVDEAQKTIDRNDFQQLRMLEDHLFRLRTSLTRPSTSLEFIWTILSYALTGVLWLTWIVWLMWRVFRGVVLFPFRLLRWLFLLR
ncbi:hypothetical protein JCM6882_009138 [Rhodosporidiobolus microsporus]